MKPVPLIAAMAGCIFAAGLATGAHAQDDQDRRIDRLEKEIRELRSIVFQGRDTGQPVVVKPAGPDPAVEALQSRADQQDQTIRTLSGRLEVLGHDLDEARRQLAADHDAEEELRGEVKALTDQSAARTPPPAATNPPPSADAGGGSAPPAPNAVGPQSEASSFRDAKARLSAGDFAGAGDAFNAYLQQYGSSAHAREAYYLLGESYYGRSQYGDATVAYARALKDWPKTAWASDATVKLARSLASSNRSDQACAALSEFDRRYGTTASKTVKARAAATALAAKCGG